MLIKLIQYNKSARISQMLFAILFAFLPKFQNRLYKIRYLLLK